MPIPSLADMNRAGRRAWVGSKTMVRKSAKDELIAGPNMRDASVGMPYLIKEGKFWSLLDMNGQEVYVAETQNDPILQRKWAEEMAKYNQAGGLKTFDASFKDSNAFEVGQTVMIGQGRMAGRKGVVSKIGASGLTYEVKVGTETIPLHETQISHGV